MLTEEAKKVVFLYSNYISQLFAINHEGVKSSILNNEILSSKFYDLFILKFNPALNEIFQNESQERDIKFDNSIGLFKELVKKNKDNNTADLFLKMCEALQATVRTNYFKDCNKNTFPEYLSIKVKSNLITGVEKPYLFAEIFVYHNDFEAIHLRSAKVSRGGIRWSDRIKDFRTEIFGLVKAQILKNCVIVPSGSKGGFVIKIENPSRDVVINCYKMFLSGLLDITDNIVDNELVHPENVIVYDERDPYLVVAADKGTASFSDYANEISKKYKFWLYDAFASGGSNGYSHKGLGITARGAWESVKWHARDSKIRIGKDIITVLGIGGMSGDVFGNGLIYNDSMKMLCAINDKYIFIDPNPNPKDSFKERNRLFKIGNGVKWSDYNPKLISKGGGVFKRSDSIVQCSEEIKKMLDLPSDQNDIETNLLIRKLLTMQVDLIWSGGIGTFVKSSKETNKSVKDSVNDEIRVNGCDLKAKMIGEGANLSLTQLGRVEYCENGGYCFTDSIDNSAGVDCSDYEVNIKILLHSEEVCGNISKEDARSLLLKVEKDVVKSVLLNNNRQAGALSMLLSKEKSTQEKIGKDILKFLLLNNAIDLDVYHMPCDEEIEYRNKKGVNPFLSSEIAVLISHMKLCFKGILFRNTDLFNSSKFDFILDSYFPKLISQEFPSAIKNHKLRKELIINCLTNNILNTFSMSFYPDIKTSTNCDMNLFLEAYLIIESLFNIRHIVSETDSAIDEISTIGRHIVFSMIEKSVKKSIINLLNSKLFKEFVQNRANKDKLNETKDIEGDEMPQRLERLLKETERENSSIFILTEDLFNDFCNCAKLKEKCSLKDLKQILSLYPDSPSLNSMVLFSDKLKEIV